MTLCLSALKQVLPRDIAVLLVVKWYVARNAPGTQDIAPSQEWRLFLGVLLGLFTFLMHVLDMKTGKNHV